MSPLRFALVGALVCLPCCSSDPVESRLIDSLGGETPGVPKGPLHRPGQPCVACHQENGAADTVFSLAGTVYVDATTKPPKPLPDARIHFIDASGKTYDTGANCAGNFFVMADDYLRHGRRTTRRGSDGITHLSRGILRHVSRRQRSERARHPRLFRAVAASGAAAEHMPMNEKSRDLSRLRPAGFLAAAALVCGANLLPSCSGPSEENESLTFPDSASFPAVSDALEINCGTLDCHGSIYRNMRLFGIYGARLNSMLVPGRDPTTPDEYKANYDSVVSIQPENLAAIVANHGQGFDQWELILKGTNAEVHKGGQRMMKGDPTYTCIQSWVNGAVDMSACLQSAMLMKPEEPMPSASAPTDGTPPASM
jgi:hypothetical protein